MFYQPSAARESLGTRVKEFLEVQTYRGFSSEALDEITSAEVVDLAYLQGSALDSAIAAHALFPIERQDAPRTPSPTGMSAVLPVRPNSGEPPLLEILVRWSSASALQIGEGGRDKVTTATQTIPEALLNPTIGDTQYRLQEKQGGRLRSLAGPLTEVCRLYEVQLDQDEGEWSEEIVTPRRDLVFGAVDASGSLQTQHDNNDQLLGHEETTDARRSHLCYLWAETREVRARISVRWKRRSSERITISVALRNLGHKDPDDVAAGVYLAAILLPQMTVRVLGGAPTFPPLQYAAAKRAYWELDGDDELRAHASQRLYEVQQRGCVAARSPVQQDTVVLTTYGVFDTPREPPVPGPIIAELVESADGLLGHCANHSSEFEEFVRVNWDVLKAVLYASGQAFGFERFHLFQWEAIRTNLELIAQANDEPTTLVRAPTGAGKTVVFLVNAACSALLRDGRSSSVLMFPTRLLNEDMFRRLTAFVHELRSTPECSDVTGGLLMGTSDPLYRVLLDPGQGESMHHFGACPVCGHSPMIAAELGGRMVPECTSCGHQIAYMYTPRDVSNFLPDLIIATPDKLFHHATVGSFEQYGISLLGAPCRRCETCSRACPEALIKLKPEYATCQTFHSKRNTCDGTSRGDVLSKPIRYIGFDEVHSLYGHTATFLSMFLATLQAQQVFLSQSSFALRFETATATISNERELLEALTRRRATAGQVIAIPEEGREADFFEIDEQSIRHRVLVTLPNRTTSRQAFIRSTLNAYRHLRDPGELTAALEETTGDASPWQFLLGYLFKKQEGADVRRALRDMYRNSFNEDLTVEFLSGEAPKNEISTILDRALSGDIDILLANMVISLGVDIHGLNHMVMLGVPRGFTEFVQTAGRTGRGAASGHVHIVLQPFNARDAYLYRHFHAVLSDVAGYYDVLPVRSTNLHCASEIFGNVAKAILIGLCFNPDAPVWPNAGGVIRAIDSLPGKLRSIESGMTGILCDDPTLTAEVAQLTSTKMNGLMDEVSRAGGFLSEVFSRDDRSWLITSLRGRSTNTVRMTCADEPLLEALNALPDN